MLHIWHWKPKQKTFAGLQLPTGLEEIQINWANGEPLDARGPP
jgi:hypothetical protein